MVVPKRLRPEVLRESIVFSSGISLRMESRSWRRSRLVCNTSEFSSASCCSHFSCVLPASALRRSKPPPPPPPPKRPPPPEGADEVEPELEKLVNCWVRPVAISQAYKFWLRVYTIRVSLKENCGLLSVSI